MFLASLAGPVKKKTAYIPRGEMLIPVELGNAIFVKSKHQAN